MIKRLRDESGYSLVEVMASIMILTIAIIPMVGMFDMGLNAATRGGNYDTARALANKKLEQARSLPYDSTDSNVTDVKDNFPRTAPNTHPTDGSTFDGSTETGVPAGFSYTVSKRFKCVSASTSSCTSPTGATSHLANSSTDQGIIEITVTVSWSDGNSYTVTGVVAGGTASDVSADGDGDG